MGCNFNTIGKQIDYDSPEIKGVRITIKHQTIGGFQMTIFANFSTASNKKTTMRNEATKFYCDQVFKSDNSGEVIILVGCKDGFKAHIQDMRKRGYTDDQITICEIQEETYIELKKHAKRYYPKVRVLHCDIAAYVNMLSQNNQKIAYIEADGVDNFSYKFDLTLIKLMIEDENINSLQLVGSLRGRNDSEIMASEFNFRRVRARVKKVDNNGNVSYKLISRSKVTHRPIHYIPVVLKSLLENTGIQYKFETYLGVNNGRMYMINLKR